MKAPTDAAEQPAEEAIATSGDASPIESSGAPARLLEGGGTAFERSLLSSATLDRMPQASLERLAHALHVPRVAPVSSLGNWFAGVRLARIAGFGGLGMFGLLGAFAAVLSSAVTPPEPHVSPPPGDPPLAAPSGVSLERPETPKPLPAREVPAAAAERILPSDATRSDTTRSHPTRSNAAARRSSRTHADRNPAEPAYHSLREELRALEQLQTELRRGRLDAAERALSAYESRFPRGKLAPEAELLAIDLDLSRGRRARAITRARALLARPDGARYRERLTALSTIDQPASPSKLEVSSDRGVDPPPAHMEGRRSP
jgi:hypothetical protein